MRKIRKEILKLLEQESGLTIKEISEKLGRNYTGVYLTVKNMILEGLVSYKKIGRVYIIDKK